LKIFTSSILFLAVILFSCSKKTSSAETIDALVQYTISGTKIFNNNLEVLLIGANAFHVFSAGGSDMNSWKIDVSREFVGNMLQQPLSGNIIQDSTGAFLYPLQTIVDSNRVNKRITILCPFGWNGLPANVFSGLMPTQTYWWPEFQTKLKQWAIQFANQTDVWIEVWNEPYRYDRTDGYTDEKWMSDMNSLVSIIRKAGNKNIILVPCAEQGQDESVLNNKGGAFLSGKTNILFDVHAYENWLLVTDAQIGARLQQLWQNNIPVIFGETAPLNAGALMNPNNFIDSVYNRGLSICAWV
jgi:mannan endo-1,4-beta-mannosidase